MSERRSRVLAKGSGGGQGCVCGGGGDNTQPLAEPRRVGDALISTAEAPKSAARLYLSIKLNTPKSPNQR